MKGRLVVRPKARRDITGIALYIAKDNLDASDRFIDPVYTAFENSPRCRFSEARADFADLR
jgi:plasmid stabilization system protein ParE